MDPKKDNVFFILISSLLTAIKEWRYLIIFMFLGILNIYLLITSGLDILTNTKSIIYIFTFVVLIFGYHLSLGYLGRKSYGKKPLEFFDSMMRAFYSTVIFLLFFVLWFATVYVLSKFIDSIVLSVVLSLVYVMISTSVILENIKVFFLEKEIFSLYHVFLRLGNIRFLAAFFITSLLSTLLYPLGSLLSNLLGSTLTSLLYYNLLYSIINGIIVGYITLFIIIFFFKTIDLENE